jgi:YD repeat-containing protein
MSLATLTANGWSCNPIKFDDSAGHHLYGYDGSGNLVTDTLVVGTKTYVKTFTYSGSELVDQSDYVEQP